MRRTTRSFCTAAGFLAILPICAGCSSGLKSSDQANHNWSPAKQGMTHDQFMAEYHEKMGQGLIGKPKIKVPAGAPSGAKPNAPGGSPK